MAKVSRDFQIFVKPAGARCNMRCHYCYYLEKSFLDYGPGSLQMPSGVLEKYISQHISAHNNKTVMFSWHGGEPLLCGIDFFKNALEIQKKYLRRGQIVLNGIQTNGTLINKSWCSFFAENDFYVGISIDGPEKLHNTCRVFKSGGPSFEQVIRGHNLLQEYGINYEILCVVNSCNVMFPQKVYSFFKEIGARYVSFLPLVVPDEQTGSGVTNDSVPAVAFGRFLCEIFDTWKENDIGKIKVQIFEEALRVAFGQDHTLCIFKKTCGTVPVIEHNGDFYSCDHFVDQRHYLGNIMNSNLSGLLEAPSQISFGQEKLNSLPHFCLECDVLNMCNGECPKNRFIYTPDGERGLNYLCEGYRLFFRHCRPFIQQLTKLWNLYS